LVVGLVASLLAPSAPATLAAPLPVPPPNTDPVPPMPKRPLLLLGTAGLRWSDVSTTNTPTLAALAETWGIGNMAVRTVRPTTCPADGWLTVSAGNRTSDALLPGGCRDMGGVRAGRVDWWDQYLQGAQTPDEAVPGLLGDVLTVTDAPVAGIGPGAAVALARTDGTAPERWVPRPEDPEDLTQAVVEALKGGTRVVVVDLGVVHDDASAKQVDAALHAALAGAGGADVLVASLADRPGEGPDLQLAAWGRPEGSSPGMLTSASTRQSGIVENTDVTATLLGRVGMGGELRPPWVTGKLIRPRAPGDGIAGLLDAAEHANAVQPLVSRFYVGLVVVNVVLFAGVWFALARPPGRRTDETQRRRVLRWLQVAGLAVAAVPISLLLANLVPWWRTGSPGAALAAVAVCIVAVLVIVALAGPWRRSVLGPAGLLAAVTAIVLVVDVTNGSRLQLSAVFGSSSLVAQRFYGFTNATFALVTVGTLVAVSALVVPLVRSGRRWWAAAVVVAAGTALTVVDGAGSMGADFGGPPAVVPAFLVLALLLVRAPVTWRRAAEALAAAAAVTIVAAVVVWLLSDQPTHLGDHLALTLATIAGFAFVVAALVRPVRRLLSDDRERYAWLSHGAPLSQLGTAAPTLVPCVAATGTALVVGLLFSSWGVAIPALGVAIVVPLVIATSAGWMSGLAPADGAGAFATEQAPGRFALVAARVRQGVRPPVLVVAVGVVALVAVLVPTAVSPSPPALSSTTTTRPLVLVGVAGLRWEDVGLFSTPALWDLSRGHAVGQVVVRSVHPRACPVDGWLAVSSGTRLAGPRLDNQCASLRDPVGEGTSASVSAWPDYEESADTQGFAAQPGLLGDEIRAAQVSATAIGPGAAIAIADSKGVVAGTYHRRPGQPAATTSAVTDALQSSSLVVVDAGVVRDPGYATVDPEPEPGEPEPEPEPGEPERPAEDTAPPPDTDEPSGSVLTDPDRAGQVKAVDEQVGAVMAAVAGTDATVLVVSLADSGRGSLRLAAMVGPVPGTDEPAQGLLTSASTRQAGLFQAADVLPTVLLALGVESPGATITTTAGSGTAAGRLFRLMDTNRHAVQISRASSLLTDRLMNAFQLLMLVSALVLTRAAHRSSGGLEDQLRRWTLLGLRAVSVVIAAVPVSAYLTNVLPWWQSPTPQNTFWTVLVGFVVGVTVVAFVGPWRRSLVGPMGAVMAVTTVVLTADAALGGRLVVDAPFGAHRLLGARFYGTSNQGFALLTVASLILAAVVARALLARGERTAAWLAVAMTGLVVVVADGMPGLGSDFGGPPAMVPAFALLGVVVAGRRVRWPLVLGVIGAAVVVVVGFAWADYLRPAASRTHLGRFVATVLDGGLRPVLERKAAVNLRMLSAVRYTVPTVLSAALTLWLADWPGRRRLPGRLRGRLTAVLQAEPLLRPTVAAVTVAMVLGVALNDSGVVITATGLVLAVPMLVAVFAGHLGDPDEGDDDEPADVGLVECHA